MASNLHNAIQRLYPPSQERWELHLKNLCSANGKLMDEVKKDRECLERLETRIESVEKTSAIGTILQQQSQTILEEVRSMRTRQREQDTILGGVVQYIQNQQEQMSTLNEVLYKVKEQLAMIKVSVSNGVVVVGTPSRDVPREAAAASRRDGPTEQPSDSVGTSGALNPENFAESRQGQAVHHETERVTSTTAPSQQNGNPVSQSSNRTAVGAVTGAQLAAQQDNSEIPRASTLLSGASTGMGFAGSQQNQTMAPAFPPVSHAVVMSHAPTLFAGPGLPSSSYAGQPQNVFNTQGPLQGITQPVPPYNAVLGFHNCSTLQQPQGTHAGAPLYTSTPAHARPVGFPQGMDMPSPMPPPQAQVAGMSANWPPASHQGPMTTAAPTLPGNPQSHVNRHPSPLNQGQGGITTSTSAVTAGPQTIFRGIATIYQGPHDQDSAEFEGGSLCKLSIIQYQDGTYLFVAEGEETGDTVAECILQSGMGIDHECEDTALRWNVPGDAEYSTFGIAVEFGDGDSAKNEFEQIFKYICK